jgi:hypothetical protein
MSIATRIVVASAANMTARIAVAASVVNYDYREPR